MRSEYRAEVRVEETLRRLSEQISLFEESINEILRENVTEFSSFERDSSGIPWRANYLNVRRILHVGDQVL